MSLQCQQCGSVQPGGKFCPNCGGQMVPMAQPQPQQPQTPPPPPQTPPPHPAHQMRPPTMPTPPMPQQPSPFMPPPPQPAKSGGKGIGLWLAIGGGLLAVLAIAAFVLLSGPDDKPAVTTPTAGPSETKPTDNPPAKTDPAPSGSLKLKVLSQGAFGARPDSMVSYGNYLGFANDSMASIYKFDASGKPQLITSFQLKEDQGQLQGMAVGPLNNDGVVQMLALYEYKLYVVPGTPGGEIRSVDNNAEKGVSNIVMGDYDGDGKTETIIFGKDNEGKNSFQVWRYPADSWTYKKEGRQDPWPELFQTELKAGKKSLLMGYEFVGDALNLLLYQWDGVGGPAVYGRYPVENKAEAPPEFIASGNTGLGATLAVVRGGAKATVELLTIAQDGKSAKSLGRFEPAGGARQTVLPGKFTGQNSQVLTVDEQGNYTLYDLGK